MQQMQAYILTDEGRTDFSNLLKQNDHMAYVYLKQNVNEISRDPRLAAYVALDFLIFLVSSVSRSRRHLLCEYIDGLSNSNLIEESFLKWAMDREELDVLSAIFRKYTYSVRSDQLFVEIGRNIQLMEPMLSRVYFDGLSGAVHPEAGPPRPLRSEYPLFYSKYLLEALYSFLFQDIHPFFEDNADKLFQVFFILYDDSDCRSVVVQLYDLFITKYPDCTNFEQVVSSLTRSDEMVPLELQILARAYEYRPVGGHLILSLLQRILRFELDGDGSETYTQEMLRGVDIRHGCTHRLIRVLNYSINGGICMHLEGEQRIFAATVLKLRDDSITQYCSNIVNDRRSAAGLSIAFSAFHYLITMKEFFGFSQEYLTTPVRFIAMKYLSLYMERIDTFHQSAMGLVEKQPSPAPWATLPLALELARAGDVFSVELLFWLVRTNESLCSHELYDELTRVLEKVEKMAMQPLRFYFDVYFILIIRLTGRCKDNPALSPQFNYNVKLIEKIMTMEIVELYEYCFYYISLLLAEDALSSEVVLNILQQDAIWGQKQWHPSLVCMLMAAYFKGVITDLHIMAVSSVLSPYCHTVLMNKTVCAAGRTSAPVKRPEDAQEVYLLTGACDRNWFLSSFMDKKYVRLVLKKMISDKFDKEFIHQVLAKNRRWIEFEVMFHGITEYFDL